MKLRCKIYPHYLREILQGKKVEEYRQVESIIFECDDEEYEFEVRDVENADTKLGFLEWAFPDIEWKPNLPVIKIRLGRRIR